MGLGRSAAVGSIGRTGLCAIELEKFGLQGNRNISGYQLVIGIPSTFRARRGTMCGWTAILVQGKLAQDGEQRPLVLCLSRLTDFTLFTAKEEQEWNRS